MIWIVRLVQGFAVITMLLWVLLWGVGMLVFFGVGQEAIEIALASTFEISVFDGGGLSAVLAAMAITLGVSLNVYTYYRLFRLFSEFAAERYFSKAAVNHMWVFAGLYALSAFLVLLHSALFSDQSQLNFKDITSFVFGLIFFIIAYILAEARKAREELDDYF